MSKEEYYEIIEKSLWKNELKRSIEKRSEARYIGDNLIALSCTVNMSMKEDFVKLRTRRSNDLNIVPITSDNIDSIIEFIGKFRFEIDQQPEDYLALCLGSRNQKSHFIVDDEGNIVCNICDSETISGFIYDILGGELI